MRIGAAEPERTHRRQTAPTRCGPREGAGCHLDRHPVPIQMRVRRLKMQVRRDLLVLQHQHDLDQARDASGRFKMTDVGLGGTDVERLRQRPALTVNAAECFQLDRIPQRRPRAVGFHVSHVETVDARLLQCLADQSLLRHSVRRGETVARPIVIHRRAANAGEDRISVTLGVRHSFQDDQSATFATDVPVGRRVERLGSPVGGQRRQFAERDRGGGREHQVHTTRQRQVALALPQRLTRLIHGNQRRGAGGIELHDRPVQSKHIGDPARRDAARRADRPMGTDLGQAVSIAVVPRCGVVVGTQSDEHARFAAVQ